MRYLSPILAPGWSDGPPRMRRSYPSGGPARTTVERSSTAVRDEAASFVAQVFFVQWVLIVPFAWRSRLTGRVESAPMALGHLWIDGLSALLAELYGLPLAPWRSSSLWRRRVLWTSVCVLLVVRFAPARPRARAHRLRGSDMKRGLAHRPELRGCRACIQAKSNLFAACNKRTLAAVRGHRGESRPMLPLVRDRASVSVATSCARSIGFDR